MLKRLPVVLGILLLAACRVSDPLHESGSTLTWTDLRTLPGPELSRRVMDQLAFSGPNDPALKARVGGNHLFARPQARPGGFCQQDILDLRYEAVPGSPDQIRVKSFTAHSTYSRLADFPQATDCADPRVRYYDALSLGDVQLATASFDHLRQRARNPDFVLECRSPRQPVEDCPAVVETLSAAGIYTVQPCFAGQDLDCVSIVVGHYNVRFGTTGGELKKVILERPLGV